MIFVVLKSERAKNFKCHEVKSFYYLQTQQNQWLKGENEKSLFITSIRNKNRKKNTLSLIKSNGINQVLALSW